MQNYEKHALRVSQVIAVLGKSACKHVIYLAARVNKKILYLKCKVQNLLL